jgi:hypothetical protein
MKLKAGARLRSAVGTAEVIVVKSTDDDVDLCCAGAPMLMLAESVPTTSPATTGVELQIGKRYVYPEIELEVLCTKAGPGPLSVGDAPLVIKDAKPLPASD